MWNESFCPCVNRKMHLDFRTGVIKSNFQAFKILRWPVSASLKIEKKSVIQDSYEPHQIDFFLTPR